MTATPDDEPSLDRAGLQSRAIRGAAWTAIHTVISLPIAFLVNLLIARILGVVDYGRLTYLTMLIATAGSFVALGVGAAVLQFGAKAHSAGRTQEVRSLLRAASGWRLLVIAPFVTLVVIFLVRVDPIVLILVLVFGIWLPAALGGLGIALNIEQKTAEGAQAALIGSFLTQGAVVLSVLAVGTAESVWAARMIATTLVILILLPFISKPYRKAVMLPGNPFKLPRQFWRFAVPTGLAGLVGALVTSRSEVLLLQWMSDPVSVGLFGLAFGLASHVFAPAQSFIGPLVPAVSGLVEVDPGSVRPAFLRVLRCSAVVAGVFVAGALPGFAALVPVLYGVQFAAAADMVLTLGVFTALGLIAGPITAFVYARLGGRTILRIEILSLLVNVTVAVMLIPPLGAWGAVIASACAIFSRTLLLGLGEVRHLQVSTVEAAKAVGPLVFAAVIALMVWLGTAAGGIEPITRSALMALAGTSSLIIAVRVSGLGLKPQDRDAISNVAPGRIRPLTRRLLGLLTSNP